MGNPRGVTTTSAPDSFDGDNGILPKLTADVISDGSGRLPPAESRPGETRTVEVDAGWLGPVRITYLSKKLKAHRSSWWVWVGVRADTVS